MAKTWSEKFYNGKQPFVEVLEKRYADMQIGDKMLVANPEIIDEYIRQIPNGKQISIKTMRKDIALEYGADNMCPLTTGIFLRIIAEKAHEEYMQGKQKITPFWRVIDLKLPMVKKLTFDKVFISLKRKTEKIIT